MLYLIPTPIGNTEDITLRALRLFQELEYFICEDTRTFKSLLTRYQIKFANKNFFSLTSFISTSKISKIISLCKEQNVGMVSESGTPGLSDPGKILIKYCRQKQILFEVLPGANALIPSIVGANTNTQEFLFLGFIPTKKGRQSQLKRIINLYQEMPVCIYESVHRIEKTLLELTNLGYQGNISLFREISKLFAQNVSGTISEILTQIQNQQIKLKGEFVVVFH